jgi:hypothetical protein
LNGWLTVCTTCVVVGLVVEYLPEVFAAIKVRPFRWSPLKAIAGGILVTVGVAGELWIHFLAAKAETRLRTINSAAFAQFNKEAGDARRAAGEAIERAAKLDAAIANRHLTREQQVAIGSALSKYAGRVLYLRSSPGDTPAIVLALEIKAALERARIRVEDRTGQPIGLGETLTFGIRIDCGDNERGLSELLARTLKVDGGLDVVPLSPQACSGGPTEVFIGPKPIAGAK